MPIPDYPIDEVVGFTGRFFSDPAQTEPIDPSTVALRVRSPSAEVTTYASPTHDDTGVFVQEVTLDEVGDWTWRWYTTGPVCIIQGVVTCTHDLTNP
jgi:hypothetical protein